MKKSRLKRWQVVTLIAGSVIVMGFLTGILVRNRVENKEYVESTPTFMVIKNGQVLKQCSGTNPAKIDQLMLRGDAK
ncbi:hypothetical protein [Levilactobacillus brevis]|uniref:hypothetical protein n=1 Tax=Levilactobacillus brevis TaxID=1580 RepID=UPI00207446DA|nr:hypothetical protein [Levilactobacillus brevis]